MYDPATGEYDGRDPPDNSTWGKNPVKMFLSTVFGAVFVIVWILFFLHLFGVIDFGNARVGNYPIF